jgi:hypothetical protein
MENGRQDCGTFICSYLAEQGWPLEDLTDGVLRSLSIGFSGNSIMLLPLLGKGGLFIIGKPGSGVYRYYTSFIS